MEKLPNGLKITELVIGDGALAEQGKVAVTHYRGFLSQGEQFRSSYDVDEPVSIRIGSRDIIAGVEKGIVGMRVGGKRRLKVSPHLAYRDVGAPGIPPNAVLIFEIELLDVQD
jgi:FKBP-type peptidyl-prolyl cis-trans isomerase